jgi:hypothetical protein
MSGRFNYTILCRSFQVYYYKKIQFFKRSCGVMLQVPSRKCSTSVLTTVLAEQDVLPGIDLLAARLLVVSGGTISTAVLFRPTQ